jgi:hypothetical protein
MHFYKICSIVKNIPLKYFICIPVVALLFLGCNRSTQETQWLLGSWCNITPKMRYYENWTLTENSDLAGECFVLRKSDTVFFERMQLKKTKNGWDYNVTVRNQNQAKAIIFSSTCITADSLVFENKNHDYPNRIVYKKISNDQLVARIFGIQNGKPTTEVFPMKKVYP